MTLNPNNDVYTGDLSILNIRKHAWEKGDKRSDKYRKASYIILLAGLICIIVITLKMPGGDTIVSRLPVHIAIWTTALITYLVMRKGKKLSQEPFSGYHNARFEVDDDTIYYVYQQGMSMRTYYIHDDDIEKITRDDEAGVILIDGNAAINIRKRRTETEEKTGHFYALVPFDKYDLDDLLAPYKKKVRNAHGKLRLKYIEEQGE